MGGLLCAQVAWRTCPGEENVSAEFASLPVQEALARVLRRRSFFVVYSSPEGLPRRIVILGPSDEEPAGRISDAPGPGPDASREDRVAPGTLDPAVEAMLADQNPDVRLRMLETVAALDTEDLRRQLVLDR